MPAAMSLSSEENREYASLYTDISTYASERLTQFITGVANIDTEWDAYVAQIKAMGIDRCVEIQQ
jgi:putative aldouronate transport system substrate-binding protein